MSDKIVLKPLDAAMRPLLASSPNIKALLPPGLNLDRFMMQIKTALNKTPKLMECTPQSLLGAVIEAADLGLDPSGRLGSAYLIPFKGKVTLVPGYRGLIDLAGRSGLVRSINAYAVHEKDHWKHRVGFTPEHIPYEAKLRSDPDDPGQWLRVWARARMAGNVTESEVMSYREVMAIKARSPGGSNPTGPWFTDEEEMAKKTVLRRILKKLPLSPTANWDKLSRALDMGDGAIIDGGEGTRTITTVFEEGEFTAHDPETGEVVDQPQETAAQAAAKKL